MDCTCGDPTKEHANSATCGICPCGRPTGRHPFHVIALCDACFIFWRTGRPFGAALRDSVAARRSTLEDESGDILRDGNGEAIEVDI